MITTAAAKPAPRLRTVAARLARNYLALILALSIAFTVMVLTTEPSGKLCSSYGGTVTAKCGTVAPLPVAK